MAKVIAGMTMSLDGFVADATGNSGPLYPDLAALQGTSYMNAMIERTGAVLMGKRSSRWVTRTRTLGTTSSRCRSSC